MKTFGERLKEVRKERGFKTQSALAKRLGGKTTHTSISDWENDKYKPDRDAARKLMSILGVNWDYLEGKEKPKYLDESLRLELVGNIDYMYKYPVLDWVNLDRGVGMQKGSSTVLEFETAYKSSDCFGLVINNESMAPEFTPGEQILVDRGIKTSSGDYCIVRLEDGSHILRQYVKDGGESFIKAVNPDWPNKLKPLNDSMLIVGKVIEARRSYI